MKIFRHEDRQKYKETQIRRSNIKFNYCKVSVKDAVKYKSLLIHDLKIRNENKLRLENILCLGTRNGREVDLFRIAFSYPLIVSKLISFFERRKRGFQSFSSGLHSLKRSKLTSLGERVTLGVEINPRGGRKDIWTGSFDEMPDDWEDSFNVIYSNSFDQSQDPYKTSKEWWRVCAPGGYMIFAFNPMQNPTATDPVGEISIFDAQDLFPEGELIYYLLGGSGVGYTEMIFRKPIN